MKKNGGEQALLWIALNLPFFLFRPAAPLIDDPFLRSLAVGLVLFVLPGLPLVVAFLKTREPSPLTPLWIVAASAAVNLGVLLLTRALGAAPDAGRMWGGVWLATNAAQLLAGGRSPRDLLPGRRTALTGLLVFMAAYAAYFHGATRVVPPMDDHDYETQGTGHGLLTALRPSLLTDRGTSLYFAHPPLLHLFVAESFLYWNRLDALAKYADATTFEASYELFRRDPAPLPTRTPNIFLAALTAAMLGAWAARLSGRIWLGGLIAAAYASSPEVFVRSSYGGYFAIGQFAVLSILLADTKRDWLLAGAFAALVDHKLVFLPLALAAWQWTPHPAAIGFLAGTALFWLWGLSIDAGAFWLDHLRTHLVDRLTHHNPLGYGGYPGPLELWLEFARHTGYAFLPLGAAAWIARLKRDGRRSPLATWAAWALMLSLAFTIVDWRQTKHLTPLLLPLFLATALWASADHVRRRVTAAAMLGLIFWNLQALCALAQNFAGFTITPAW